VSRTVAVIERELRAAEQKSLAASDRRRALPPGTSRSRVTTANARWISAAEERDRLRRELAAALEVSP